MRVFRGQGCWAILTPLRLLLSWCYHLWLTLTAGGGFREERHQSSRMNVGSQTSVRVVSIGNLEIGGGGKTPCTIRLAEAVAERGGKPVVVTRGYRSIAERRGPLVVLAGQTILKTEEYMTEKRFFETVFGSSYQGDPPRLAEWIGDEVVLYRRRGIPVVIDPKRARGVDIAARVFAPTHILLDDAFQHRSVDRDLDILLLDQGKPFGNGRLLPMGTLREHPDATRRAGVVIFTRATENVIPPEARSYLEGKSVFFATHSPVDLMARDGRCLPLSSLEGKRTVLFSGIARHVSFESLLVSVGAQPTLSIRYADHHRYTSRDVDWMLGEADTDSIFVTTEKDWVKAAEFFPPHIEVLALGMSMEIGGFDKLLDLVF